MIPAREFMKDQETSNNCRANSEKDKHGNKSCSVSSINLKDPLKELLPPNYVPKKLDFSKNEGEAERKNSAYLKRKWSHNIEKKPLDLKVRKEFILDNKGLWKNNTDFAFDAKDFINKKLKTEENKNMVELSNHGLTSKGFEGYDLIKIQKKENDLTLMVKDKSVQEYFSLIVISGDFPVENLVQEILNKTKENEILLKIEKFWSNSGKHFFLVEKIEMELTKVILKSFTENEVWKIIKNLGLFSKLLIDKHIFLSLALDNMVITSKNECKLLLDFKNLNLETQILKRFEVLSLKEQNLLYVSQIGQIAFFIITTKEIREFDPITLQKAYDYSSNLKETIAKMITQQLSLEDLLTLN